MATGKIHATYTQRNLKLLGAISLAGLLIDPSSIGIAVGLAVGHLLTPDIDHHLWTYEEYRIYRFSKVLGWLWFLYWFPYSYFHKHRGWSHTPIIGTVGRFIYLLWLPLLLTGSSSFWGYVLIGWVLQDITHLWLDR